MKSSVQRLRAQRFVELHREGCLLLPNAWDVGSARIMEAVGFPAVATTSAGVAFSLGRPDHDFYAEHGEFGRVDRETMMGRVRSIAHEIEIPVSADLEEGYGDSPEEVAQTVSLAIEVGAVGGNIEDFTGDRRDPLFEFEQSVERISAARAAIDASGIPFLLNARTDAILVGLPFDECVRRGNAFMEAGADCVFVPGVSGREQIGELVREIDGPVNIVMGLTGNALAMADLRELGVRRVTVGGSVARAMYHHLLTATKELFEHGTFGYASDQLSQDWLNAAFLRKP